MTFFFCFIENKTMEEFRQLCKVFGCRSVIGIAGAPLRSYCGLFVVVITSYCACGPLHQSVPARRWVKGHDFTSSGVPLGWWGVPGMIRSSRRRVGQSSCTSHCLHLSLVPLVSPSPEAFSGFWFPQSSATDSWMRLEITREGEVIHFETE